MHPQYQMTCKYFITTSHIIHSFGWYAAYLILQCSPWDSPASPMSSTNPLSEWSSQTPSKVCLCTKNSTTIYCNQTLCIGRGTWGALCVLPTLWWNCCQHFSPSFQRPRYCGKTALLCPLSTPPPLSRNTTVHSQLHIYNLRLVHRTWRKWLLFSVYCASPSSPRSPLVLVFIARTWLDFCCTKPGSPGANWFYSSLWLAGENYARASLWIWNMISLLPYALLRNEKGYSTAGG